MTTALMRSLAAATLFTSAASMSSAGETIVELAPEDSIIVVSVPSVANAREQLEQSGLWDLWQSDEIQKMVADGLEMMGQDLDALAEELGVDRESIQLPTGNVGVAVFPEMNEEEGMSAPAVLMVADFGDHAEGMGEVLDAMVSLAREGGDEVDEHEIAGRTVHSITSAAPEDEMDEMDGGEMGGMMLGASDALSMDTMHIVRDGTRLMAATSLGTLRGTFEIVDDGKPSGLGDRDDFHAIHDRIDRGDAWAVLMMRDIDPLLAAFDPMRMSMMIKGLAWQLIGEIGGVGMSANVGNDIGQRDNGALYEQTLFVHMPNGTAGLSGLFDVPAPRGGVPGFVAADALSYSRVNFRFGGVAEALRPLLQMLPMFLGGMGGGEEMPDFEQLINDFTGCLGSEIHMLQVAQRPITASSMQQVIAIEAPNGERLEQMIAGLGAQFGLEGRDFQGNRIFAMDPGMMGMMGGGMVGAGSEEPPALGLGGGYLFIGQGAAVEGAMRSLGDSDAASLANEAAFARAASTLPGGDVIAWGYADLVSSIEIQSEVTALQMKDLEAMMADLAEEFGEEAAAEFMDMQGPMGALSIIDAKFMKKHLGPMSWFVQSAEDGFVFKQYQLGAE